jgi:hypothetical protein
MNDGNLVIFDPSGNSIWAAFSQPGVAPWGEPIIPPLNEGFNARFNGTYTVLLVADRWDAADEPHTVTFMMRQCEYQRDKRDSPVISRTFTPNSPDVLPGGFVSIGEMTIPDRALPPENVTAYYQYRIESDHPNDRWSDLILLDTQGETVLITQPDANQYTQYFIDEPTADQDIGLISGARGDRRTAVSVLAETWASGGPITVEPGDNQLFVYSADGPPALQVSYTPRWMVDSSEES